MTDQGFREADCAVGGCACAHWSDWWTARREFARASPAGQALDAIVDDTAYSEALDALAEAIPEAQFPYRAPACTRPDCRRYGGVERGTKIGTP